MPVECRELFDLYQNIEYDSMELSWIYKEGDVISIVFRDKTTERSSIGDMNSARETLSFFLQTKEEAEKCDLFFCPSSDRGDWSYEISNYVNTDGHYKLVDYSGSVNGWWIYGMRFENWKELENNFCYVEGIFSCQLNDMSDIVDADPSVWKDLKYLNISYYEEDAPNYENELRRLFPGCEISVGNGE